MVSDDWGYIRESVVLRTSSAADMVHQTSQQWRYALESILNTHQEMKLTLNRFAGNPNQALQKKIKHIPQPTALRYTSPCWLASLYFQWNIMQSGLKQPWGQLSQIQTGQQAPVKLPQLISSSLTSDCAVRSLRTWAFQMNRSSPCMGQHTHAASSA